MAESELAAAQEEIARLKVRLRFPTRFSAPTPDSGSGSGSTPSAGLRAPAAWPRAPAAGSGSGRVLGHGLRQPS